MPTTTRSIDAAANGYVRHRFVRALSASFVVATVFGLIAVTAGASVYSVSEGGVASLVVLPLGFLLVFLLFVLPVAIVVAMGGAIVDLLHRRLIGLVLFVGGLCGFLFLLTGVIYSAGVLLGFDMTTANNPEGIPQDDALWFGLFGLVSCVIAYELMREGWWQLVVSAENFRAVRGWRPPPWRLFTSFRRYLGLPSFLSYVGKKRRMVTLLYFGVAVLNLGLVMLLMLPTFIGSEGEQTADFNPLIAYGSMGALLLLNLFGAGAILARLADKRATQLYQNVREWDSRTPIIFLRAFDQDDNKLKARGGDAFARWPAGVGRPRTLDEILLEHGSPYGPVIAIGDPRDPTPPLGAARVFVPGEGDAWQDVVRGLAGASKAVVMCPNHGEGVQWELDLIAQAGGRIRTIFLASPELDREANLALFTRLVPEMPELAAKQSPLAAYQHDGQWRVLTTKRASVESYTAALNAALQALFGLKGEPAKPKRV
jgi:hypothetical protein